MKDIILPSKGNFLTLEEVELMYPDVAIPLFPECVSYRPKRDQYEAEKKLNGKHVHICSSKKDFSRVIKKYVEFCEKNKIKP